MPTVGHRLLREAVERIGVEQTALKMNLSALAIDELRTGQREMNDALLLKLIDLIDALPKKV